MSIKKLPSQKYLRECFSYDLRTGELRWKHRPLLHFADARAAAIWNSRSAGRTAGRVEVHGYHVVRVSRPYRAHRLIWKWMTDEEPPETIDHIDGNKTNNAWHNLRSATIAEQKWNAPLMRTNTTGHRGVYRSYEKWQAQIVINGRTHCLGTFSTAEEASAVYEDAAKKFHGEFFRKAKK